MVTRTRESAANSQRERYSANHDPDHDAGNEPEVNYSPDRSEAAHQDHAMRFEEAISGQARAAYRNRKDLMDYSAEDRKEVLREWVEGFHGTVFESANERLDAARDIAASVFRPYHDRLDAHEYETSKLSPEEPFDIYVVMGANTNLAGAASATGEGAANDAGQQNYIDIKVKNLEEAQRIMQETGGQARITYLERHHLQAYENRFAAFLMQSREDPDSYVSHLEETLSGASAFSRGEDDLGFWQSTSFDWLVEHEKSDEVAVAIVIDSAVAGNWSTFDVYLDYLRDQGQDVSNYEIIGRRWQERHIPEATEALNDLDRAEFDKTITASGEDANDLLYRIRTNTGFIDHSRAENYHPPELPEEFTSVADAHEYITAAAAELTHLQNAGAIEPVAYDNTKLLLLEMGLLTEEIDDKKNYPDVTDRGFEHGELAKLSAVNVFLIQAACDGLGDQKPEPGEFNADRNDSSTAEASFGYNPDDEEDANRTATYDKSITCRVSNKAKNEPSKFLLSVGVYTVGALVG